MGTVVGAMHDQDPDGNVSGAGHGEAGGDG